MMDYTYKFYNYLPEAARLIRTEVFVEEQGFANEFDDTDESCVHTVLWAGNEPAAVGRLIDCGDGVYAIGRVAVRKQFRGTGLGTEVMGVLENKARESGGKKVWVSAQCRAKSFYEGCGYTASGETYFDEHVEHIHMEKLL